MGYGVSARVLLAAMVAGSVLAPVSARAASETGCYRAAESDFSGGLPPGWGVHTGVNTDGTPVWHVTDDRIAGGDELRSDATGIGEKDDRLVAPPVVPGEWGVLRLTHEWFLEQGVDGGVVEVSSDGGTTWQGVPRAQFIRGYYNGTLGDGRRAWTGKSDVFGVSESIRFFDTTTVIDLGPYAGTQLLVSWRLLQRRADVPAGAGLRWSISAVSWTDVADPVCLSGDEDHAYLGCLTDRTERFADGLPSGWSVATAVNDDGTRPWGFRAEPSTYLPSLSGIVTDATGRGRKDDALVSPPVAVSPRTRLQFHHRLFTEGGRDGGVLEITADAGATWHAVGPEALLRGGYNGALADGRAAWTGTTPGDEGGTGAELIWFDTVVADLSAWAGQEVRLRWRLLQDAARPDSRPGVEWFLVWRVLFRDVMAAGCASGEGGRR